MRCEEFERVMFEGGDVTPQMLEHAKVCEACRALMENADVLRECAQMDEQAEIPDSFARGWRAAVRSEAAKGREPGLKEKLTAWLSGFSGQRSARVLGYAMCAVALVGVGVLLGNGGRLENSVSEHKALTMSYRSMPQNSVMARGAYGAGMETAAMYDSAMLEETVEAETQERKIVRTAQLSVEVVDMDEAMRSLKEQVFALGGAVILQEVDGVKGEGRYGNMELSVPSDALDGFLATAGGLGKVKRTSMEETDMSASYYDNASRLESARAQKQRLDELYADAEEMSDIVTITDALFDVQREIDALAGQNAWIDDRASNARVNIALVEPKAEAPLEENGFFAQLAYSFMDGVKSIGAFFGSLVLFAVWALPWLVLIALIAAGVYWIARRVKRK